MGSFVHVFTSGFNNSSPKAQINLDYVVYDTEFSLVLCAIVAKIYNLDRKIGSKLKRPIDYLGDRQRSITIAKNI
ncbi:MAG: hypothetical protein EAZ39_02210 [Oscillatoriales cyanobacterium]|nr:MAG: hypothetical protein EAZ39_02210 [Oscillatoriales cyanobacterium]TAG46874.1 MAG: hypothetical protein EAZ33_05570 [Oscillatoriales cyanobacterium]